MKNKLFIASLAFGVTTAAIIVPVQTEAVVKTPFKDVTTKSPYYDIIHTMRDQGIVSGFEDGTFRANESISRKHAAALVSRAKKLPAVKSFVKFKDVSESNPYFNDIKKLQQAGIFKADAKGNFNPNQPITRAEMAKILTVSFDLKAKDAKDFPDVPKNHPSYNDVKALYSNGVTTGDDGLFKPDASLTRAHYAVFMHRAMNNIKADVSLDLNKLTEGEIRGLSDTQISKLIIPYTLSYGSASILPKGETDRKALTDRLHKEYLTIYLKYVMNLSMKDSTAIEFTGSLNKSVTSMSDLLGISTKDYINLVNQAYSEGIVVSSEDIDSTRAFVIHYDYVGNKIITGLDSRIIKE